jgi:1-acyl-sn-glycerol-3-phosphate acyltransferase
MIFLLNTILYYIGWILLKTYVRLLFRKDMALYGAMPRGPKILVANHPTTSDPFILLTTVRDQIRVLILGQIFAIPVFGRYLKLSGHVPVYKKDGRKAFDAALANLRRGVSVLVFIEGGVTLKHDGHPKPRTGAVRLAYESGAPIVPIGIGVQNSHIRDIFHWAGGKHLHAKWYFRGRYAVTIGNRLRLSGNTNDKTVVRKESNTLMQNIIGLAHESAVRINS